MATEANDEWISIKTTLPTTPFPRSDERADIISERLIARPVCQSDLASLHEMRQQQDVMYWTSKMTIDKDIAETQAWMDRFLPPHDTASFNGVICLREKPDVAIGSGGMHRIAGDLYGWPELGYMLRKECWGKGLATEFVRAFLEAYAKLPRSEVNLRVKRCSITEEEAAAGVAVERLVGICDAVNAQSRKILEKCKFRMFDTFIDMNAGKEIKLLTLVLLLPNEATKMQPG